MIITSLALIFSLLMAGAGLQRFLNHRSGVEVALTVIWLATGVYLLGVVVGQAAQAAAVLTHV